MRSNDAATATAARRLAERQEEAQLALVRNRCVTVLAELPDPKQALAVVEGIRRSIQEFIALSGKGA